MLRVISKLADGAHDKVDVFEEGVQGESCQADGQCGKGSGVRFSGEKLACSEAKGSEDVRYEHITLDGKFTLDRLRLKFAIDLDDLLRDIGVLGIGKWDANGA
jgi:hypothetical protein